MSYDCDVCGKGSVDRPGKWCNECQEKEHILEMESQADWFNASRLCQICGNAWGPDSCDQCGAYHMPLYMVKRKYKCKKFKDYWDGEP